MIKLFLLDRNNIVEVGLEGLKYHLKSVICV